MAAKSFFVDYTAHQIVIGLDPTGHTIEASTRTMGLHLERASGSIVRGIQFDEAAAHAMGLRLLKIIRYFKGELLIAFTATSGEAMIPVRSRNCGGRLL